MLVEREGEMAEMKRFCPSAEAKSMQVEGSWRRWKIPDVDIVVECGKDFRFNPLF